jgi:hypothetical protein
MYVQLELPLKVADQTVCSKPAWASARLCPGFERFAAQARGGRRSHGNVPNGLVRNYNIGGLLVENVAHGRIHQR